jgi:hypothetical protein
MSIQIKRIQSNESGDFNPVGGRTRAHIEVPGSIGFTDLANSHVILRSKPTINNGTKVSNVLPCYFAQPSTKDSTNPVALSGGQAVIKNARVTAKDHGILNEQRDQNVISANLDWYTKSSTAMEAHNTFVGGGNMPNTPNTNGLPLRSPYIRYVKPVKVGEQVGVGAANSDAELNNYSELVQTEIRVPMKHIDRLAESVRQYPNLAVGDQTYRIELEDVKTVFMVQEVTGFYGLQDVTAVASLIGSDAAPLKFKWANSEDVLAKNLDMQPLYTNMPVEVAYTDSAGPKTHNNRIKKLKVNATGEVEIVLDTPAPTAGATDAITALTLKLDVDPLAKDTTKTFYNIQDIFLELHCLNLTPSQVTAAQRAMRSMQIPYMDYRLVKKNMSDATTDYSETLSLDPGCAAVAVFTPQNNKLVSSYDHADTYRFSLDGKYLVNRDIKLGPLINNSASGVGRQLHNHFLQKWFGNLGQRLVRFDMPYDSYNFAVNDDALEEDSHAFYPLVCPLVARDMIMNFQVRARSGQTMKGKEMYYLQVYPRQLNFQNGQLVSM